MNKQFSQKLFDQNDRLAREAIKEHLKRHGHYVMDHSNKFGVDMVRPVFVLVETERKLAWTSGPYPFQDVRIAARKKKFTDYEYTEFWVVNRDSTRAMRVRGGSLRPEFIQSVPNRFMPEGEDFFVLPLSEAEEVELNGCL